MSNTALEGSACLQILSLSFLEHRRPRLEVSKSSSLIRRCEIGFQRFLIPHKCLQITTREQQHFRYISTVAHNCHVKANSIAAKANLLRQKQIRNGKSKFVAAIVKANLLRQKQIGNGMQQPVGKSRKQICHGKSKLYNEEVPNS